MGSDEMTQNQTCEKTVLNLHCNKDDVLGLSTKDNCYQKLEKLIISSCDLSNIPSVIFSFKYLTELDLSNNSLESLPSEIGNLQNLLILNLSGNSLMTLPKSLKSAHRLTVLNASHNGFLEVPEVLFYGLRAITILDLSYNDISLFSEAPECLTNINELRISNNALEKFPNWVFYPLCQLRVLDVSENQIMLSISSALNFYTSGLFKSLRVLNIESCNFRYENIQFLSHFKNLEVLHLGNKESTKKITGRNYLESLKMDIFKNFHTIKDLYLQNAKISILPNDFDCLKNVELLNLSGNMLSWLPESFCNLTSLKVLYLTSNQLLFLPGNIGQLINLKQIHLDNNKLYEVPESFYHLNNLEFIDLYNNKIGKIDLKIFSHVKLHGIDLELNYLDILLENASECTIKPLYDSLKKAFREKFNYVHSRYDRQRPKSSESVNSGSSNKQSSVSSCDRKSTSECEDVVENEEVQLNDTNYEDDDVWEKNNSEVEKDELFDPEEVNDCELKTCIIPTLDFRNNFCPANDHVNSVMKTWMRNFKYASKGETIEEGQFDSD